MISAKIISSFSLLIACIPCLSHTKKSSLIGTKAPLFSLKDTTGTVQSLDSLLGKKIVLVFYPKDESFLCTKQLCSLRDGYGLLQHHAITVIGISPDSPEKHKKFENKQTLPFLLLSDPDKKVARLYGATHHWLNPLSWFGLIKRVTILIDQKGIIVDVIKNINVSDHALQIVDAFEKAEKK